MDSNIIISLSLVAIVILELYQIITDIRDRKRLRKRVDFHDQVIKDFNVNWTSNFQLWQQQHEINLKLIEKIHQIKGAEVDEIVRKIKDLDPEKVNIDKD